LNTSFVLELETALEKILSALPSVQSELIPLSSAARRFMAETISAPIDLPSFDNSAMDGYAVRASDLDNANTEQPIALELLGQSAAGEVFNGSLESGKCVRIFTGSPLPAGADAVVMQEDTRVDSNNPRTVWVLDRVRPWENVRLQGEDVRTGSIAVQGGTQLTAGRLALLAALGVEKVRAARQPVVGVLATGSELLEPHQPLRPGKIHESNRIPLARLLMQAGALPKCYPLVPDTLAATEKAIQEALTECDAIVTSGGVSVGEFDFVKAAWQKFGGSLGFWQVAIRPGKPFVFGQARDKFLFGLPGNPVSAFVTFLLLVRPALLRWQGATDVALPSHPSILTEPLANHAARRHFIRVIVNSRGEARPAGMQASHRLMGLADANGLVDLSPNTELAAGTPVQVIRIDL
jgi:molybdopterin molybdotransferase